MFAMPFHTWKYNIGLNLTIYQIIILLIIVSAVFKKPNKKLFFGNKYILLFLFYALLSTIILSVWFISDIRQLGGFFRSEGRFLSQIFLWFLTFSIIPLACNYIKHISDIFKYLKVYISGLILLVILGWVQFSIFYLTKVDIFPLGGIAGVSHSGLWSFDGTTFFRMSSLGGEPKTFSISLVVGFFIILFSNRHNIFFFKYDPILKYSFIFTSFATLSTSGMVLFIILYSFFLFYITTNTRLVATRNIKKTIYSLSIFFILCLFVFNYWDFISVIIQKRIFERDVMSEDWDAPIQIWLSKSPEFIFFGSGLGNVHNFAYPYILKETLFYMENSIFVAKSGYLRIVSELGLVGFFLFIFMIYNTYRKLGTVSNFAEASTKKLFVVMQAILVVIVLSFLARGSMLGELSVFMAISTTLAYSKAIRN